MVINISGSTVGACYQEALITIKHHGREEMSRAGRVLSIPDPVGLTLRNPYSRVLRDANRNANPFFHVMEVVWMMAGYSDVHWLSQFNKRMPEFADNWLINGAYGARWFRNSQIEAVVDKLRFNPETRQAVIAMWDPGKDNFSGKRDYPCNTHIYFRVVHGKLDMTVCNRSNDLIWGMLGANVVHMTYLQELVSLLTDIPMGRYHVLTNNLHIYERHWPLMSLAFSVNRQDEDAGLGPPIIGKMENFEDFRNECREFAETNTPLRYESVWLDTVAEPMKQAYLNRDKASAILPRVADPAWRKASFEWLSRKSASTDTQDLFDDSTPNP